MTVGEMKRFLVGLPDTAEVRFVGDMHGTNEVQMKYMGWNDWVGATLVLVYGFAE